jgi:IMP dehydrogenase
MKIISPQTYEITFDDVLLLPNHSDTPFSNENVYCDPTTRVSKHLSIKLPIISSPMSGVTESEMAIEMHKHGGLGIIHFFMSFDDQISQVKKVKSRKCLVGASVADLSEKGFKHCLNLAKAGVDLISLESLQADNIEVLKFVRKLRREKPLLQVSVAHVVTADATEALIKAGASSVRVGIGGGSHCTTRLVTGVGRPQLSAVMECSAVAKKYNIPIISDTGIKYPGDIVKALAFGASSVMIGGLLTGTDKAPGEVIKKSGDLFKFSPGNAAQKRSYSAEKMRISFSINGVKSLIKNFMGYQVDDNKPTFLLDEGVSNFVPYKGKTKVVLEELAMSLKRSMWYLGAKNIADLQKKARVVICSPSITHENKPRI